MRLPWSPSASYVDSPSEKEPKRSAAGRPLSVIILYYMIVYYNIFINNIV